MYVNIPIQIYSLVTVIKPSTHLGRLFTRYWIMAAEACVHSATAALVRKTGVPSGILVSS